MLPKEELNALKKTLEDTILQAVPGAIESHVQRGEIAYRVENEEDSAPFCVLHILEGHLELCFPDLPDTGVNGVTLVDRDGARCLVVRKRDDIPDGFVSAACKAAARL
ncbi:hypothetical protein [Albibacillus kandeliae]|uniref:hypothetical protein n=1 Tax=Albibacillus kandeliae TaxID=2174228 RepID=UPI000D68FFCA|nr:hypothetical protein [Albibacillus kandeliae]